MNISFFLDWDGTVRTGRGCLSGDYYNCNNNQIVGLLMLVARLRHREIETRIVLIGSGRFANDGQMSKAMLAAGFECVDCTKRFEDFADMYEATEDNCPDYAEIGDPVSDSYPFIVGVGNGGPDQRSWEIRKYLEDNSEIDYFVIFDDTDSYSNCPDLAEHYINCNPDKGITEKEIIRAEEILTNTKVRESMR